MIDDARNELKAEGVRTAIRNRNTAALFDWLMAMDDGKIIDVVDGKDRERLQ